MHKSSERSDDGCVWNEDAPTVVSCAFFRLSEPVAIFNRRLFCVPPYRSDGKDTAMKSNETKKRKSGFNPNRTCYLTADGKYYCYERWDDDEKCVVTQRLEVSKDLCRASRSRKCGVTAMNENIELMMPIKAAPYDHQKRALESSVHMFSFSK